MTLTTNFWLDENRAVIVIKFYLTVNNIMLYENFCTNNYVSNDKVTIPIYLMHYISVLKLIVTVFMSKTKFNVTNYQIIAATMKKIITVNFCRKNMFLHISILE